MTPPPLLILGMHRSGTSCLTGLLEEAGLWLGEVKRQSGHNAKGNRENPGIMALNDAVLTAAGAAWNAPPEGPLAWDSAHAETRDSLLKGYPEGRVWGFKDPRTLFTLDFWRAALPQARLVGSLRHPLAVARSLQARNRMPLDRGLALWTAYNRRLHTLAQVHDLPILSFDAPPADYRAAVLRLIDSLGLTPPPGGPDFFDESLRHQTARDAEIPLPAETAALYMRLRERALT